MLGKGEHLLIFARQFSSMMASSLQLVTVLDNLGRETPQRTLRNAVREIARQVTTGTYFPDALEQYPSLFDGVFVGIIRSGMEAGRLAGALGHVADYLDRVQQVNRKAKAAAIYPCFLLLTFVGVTSGMVFYILPQYESIFHSFNKELPAATRFVLDIGVFLRGNAIAIAVLAGLVAATSLAFTSTSSGRAFWDRWKLRLPILGPVWRLAALARFSRTLAVQVSNNIPVVRSLRLAATAAGNRHIERLAREIADDIESGASVTRAFRDRPIFSGIVLQMISAGDEAGKLDELLLSAASYFDSLLVQRIDTLTGLINPALTAILGLLISGMLMAAFLPVFDLPSAMG